MASAYSKSAISASMSAMRALDGQKRKPCRRQRRPTRLAMSLKGLQFWFSLNFKLLCLRSVRKFKVSFYKWVLRRCRQITLLKAAFGISMLYSSHNSILLMIHMILVLGDTYLKIMLRESSLFLNLVDMDPKDMDMIGKGRS
ncbi:unnamed protein product [Musa banksii]